MLQLLLVKQVTVADPMRVYPLLQLYITVPPNVVVVGVPGDPLAIDGGWPQVSPICAVMILSMPEPCIGYNVLECKLYSRAQVTNQDTVYITSSIRLFKGEKLL